MTRQVRSNMTRKGALILRIANQTEDTAITTEERTTDTEEEAMLVAMDVNLRISTKTIGISPIKGKAEANIVMTMTTSHNNMTGKGKARIHISRGKISVSTRNHRIGGLAREEPRTMKAQLERKVTIKHKNRAITEAREEMKVLNLNPGMLGESHQMLKRMKQ